MKDQQMSRSAVTTKARDEERQLTQFHALPLSAKVRALDDLVTEIRGHADRWEAHNRLHDVDSDLVDAVAECLYSITGQRMGRLTPGRSPWAQLSEKSTTRAEYRAIAHGMLEHFDIRPKVTGAETSAAVTEHVQPRDR